MMTLACSMSILFATSARVGGKELDSDSEPLLEVPPTPEAALIQSKSLTQFYVVVFSQSRIGIKDCAFNKHTIKVCVSCF